jgi:hypothetical protein
MTTGSDVTAGYALMCIVYVCSFAQIVCGRATDSATTSELVNAALRESGNADQSYERARDALLLLSDDEFSDVLGSLRADRYDLRRRFLATILEFRRSEPEMAESFDVKMSDAIRRPAFGRDGDPIYRLHFDTKSRKERLLAFESAALGSTPRAMRNSIYNRLCAGTLDKSASGDVEPLLVALESETTGMMTPWVAFWLGKVAARFPDDQVVPALIRTYKRTRLANRDLLEFTRCGLILRGLGEVGTVDALVALEELETFERKLMSEYGLSPWRSLDVEGAVTAYGRALSDHRRAERAAREQGREWTDTDEAEHQEKIVAALRRLTAHQIWRSMTEAKEALVTKVGENSDGDGAE